MDPRHLQAEAATAYRSGNLVRALELLQRAAELDPREPDYLRNMAELARESGDRRRAVELMNAAASVSREAPTPARMNMLAAAWVDLGERLKALEAAAEALSLEDNSTSRSLIGDAFRRMTEVPPRYRALLVRALNEGWLGEELHRPAAALLRQYWPNSPLELARDPLLAAVLGASVVKDSILEQRLVDLRRTLLSTPLSGALPALQARIATQCFLNEYAWGVTLEERQIVDALIAGEHTPEALLKIAAYSPLGALEGAAGLLDWPWPPVVATVLRQQVAEPLAERELAAAIPSLTAIRAGVSQVVQEMYEANPYPRWAKAAPPRPVPLARALRSQFPRIQIDPIPNAEEPSILIAGCGTGSHAIHVASRYAGAKVNAIDLSRASLGYAARKTAELGINNIEYAQADLLELEGATYDLIEAGGVLHHLADPEEGARKLVSITRPGGVLRLGLYSKTARRYLQAGRDLSIQFTRDADGVRALRQRIIDAPDTDPVRSVLSSGDFYSVSNCRDLLMHVMEHQHTIRDLTRIITENGLRFLGFVLPPEVQAVYREKFSGDPTATNLVYWEAFEAEYPETFRNMYQFWLQKPL